MVGHLLLRTKGFKGFTIKPTMCLSKTNEIHFFGFLKLQGASESSLPFPPKAFEQVRQ